MHDINIVLADRPGLGRIRVCECNSVHVSIGPVTINLEPTVFEHFSTLMATAVDQLRKIRELHEDGSSDDSIFGLAHSRMTH